MAVTNGSSIHEFINGFHGGTRLNRFMVTSTCVDLSSPFHIRSAQIPGAAISAIGVNWFGRTIQLPGERVYTPWAITVLDDSGADYELHSYFERWQHSIGNKDENTLVELKHEFHPRSLANGAGCNFTIKQYRADSDFVEKTFTISNAWPVQVGPIELDMSKDNTLTQFTVTLAYTHFAYL